MNKMTLFFTLTLVTSAAFAKIEVDNSSVMSLPVSQKAADGVRVSLFKSFLDAEIELKYKDVKANFTSDIDQSTGVSVGYADIVKNNLGWIANLAYLEMESEIKVTMLRAEANGTFAFDQALYARGGLNITKFQSPSSTESWNPAVGAQLGLGYQFTKNFGLDAAYTLMRQTANTNGVEAELKLHGLEVAVTGTF